ncbi:YoaK family protein [Brevundimonas sp.]|uniref:YoaK family protein n=1 Tax=Brevundimonas sp. TaxID=1871086 RepID=UPI002AB84951|nr:YoaK family protein [Brevundimonas sp.]MDZ4363492.1 YoaK family protein [Brevundimonas sp.]
MKDYRHRDVALAAGLSALAGYVDAIGFLTLGGFFVSFMSGNSTRFGVAVAMGQWDLAATALGLIGLFVVGVVLGSTAARRAGEGRKSVVLGLEAVLLAVGAGLLSAGRPLAGMIPVVLAMGVENTVFQKGGDVRVGLTYMTGTLVRVGQRIATAMHGGARWDWVPFLLLWIGLAAGGALGALMFLRLGVTALWVAAAVVAGLALLSLLDERRLPRAES